MKTKFIILGLIALLLVAQANALVLTKLEVNIELDDEGSANYSEKYFLRMTALELDLFQNDAQENGKKLSAWKNDYSFIYPRFANEASITDLDLSFNPETKVFQLDYKNSETFSVKGKEEIRQSTWHVKTTAFENFIDATIITIPENTQIIIELPNAGEINENAISPEILVHKNTLLLSGFQGSSLFIEYSLKKPIAKPVNTIELIRKLLLDNVWNQVIVGLLVVLLFFLWIFRKLYITKIEDYIIDHTELERYEAEKE